MSQPNFDPIARAYRWLENLTFGNALHRCRVFYLPQILETRRAIVFGDGDGRFLADFLAQNPNLQASAVDLSDVMLRLLLRRTHAAAPSSTTRLTTHHLDALDFDPSGGYDLVVTHFFLDCLTQSQIEQLILRLSSHLHPDALWLISEFHVPSGALRVPSQLLIRLLYFAFRIFTGLQTTRLPDHISALERAGFTCIDRHYSVFGVLTSELWQCHSSASRII